MTHAKLVLRAKNWLKSYHSCNPVFAERGSAVTAEMPDVIGWTAHDSFVVECKTSRADFLTDIKKPFRLKPDTGMGKFRYYFFTKEVMSEIRIEEIPEGWGVHVVDFSIHVGRTKQRKSKEWTFDPVAELYYLRSRILQIQDYGK